MQARPYPVPVQAIHIKLLDFHACPFGNIRGAAFANKWADTISKSYWAKLQKNIWTFINLTRWEAVAPGAQGASWVEIFVRYILAGGFIYTADPDSRLHTLIFSVGEGLHRFRFAFTQLVTMLGSPVDVDLFQPSRSAGCRLKCLAVRHHTPCIRALPCWSNAIAMQVYEALLKLTGRLNLQDAEEFRMGNFRVQLRKVNYRMPINWIPQTSISRIIPRQLSRVDSARNVQPPSEGSSADPLLLACPTCQVVRSVCPSNLLLANRFRKLTFTVCKRQIICSRWICPHGRRWTSCTEHRTFHFGALAQELVLNAGGGGS